ncbi:penicillin acylase family protein [Deinococcus peraridilitoris]|uniref:Penicilin amidase n=1 Tax=Deinococcus peraridilitoris (strain DSM 19664 / LMG 22246 / CIP 109416 / KR-200) TaxID=937777 RepID=L0A361_DEIPD|nr:penicillin acylase family protein [Deinococcus peraridilitoris]AFZ67450.1 penicilin amidase [Deinococcus peraridilitoris DSM 19664]
MRLFLQILGGVLGLLLAVLIAVLLFVFVVTRPKTSGVSSVRGLSGEVTITRDRSGIPHIHARQSDADAFYALGFVHAQDRLWQMEFQRRIAQGRLSEVLGSAALEQDKFLRTWGFYRAAQSALPALSSRSRGLLSAYTAGVNAAIGEDRLPLEFRLLRFRPEPWTDVDSIAWQKLMAFDLGGNWQEELSAQHVAEKLGPQEIPTLFPPYPHDGPTILSERDRPQSGPAPQKGGRTALSSQTREALAAQLQVVASLGFFGAPDKGSNNWVVSGRFTRSGKPLLADDPHLSLQAPMLWYLAELRGPGLHTIGATIPGLPGVVIGRNDRIAWGVTNTNPDVQDLFIEGEDAELSERREVIKVKGQQDVVLTVLESPRGPIISGVGGVRRERVALSWTALQEGDTTMDAFVGLNYARNWQDFVTSLRAYVAPMQNFVYADVDGNIGYYAPGRVPLREGWDGRQPVPAGGPQRWRGFIPFEALPHVYNPASGMIVTANNKVTPDGDPYPLADPSNWAAPYRAQRILELLRSKPKLDLPDMAAVQNDTLSLLWRDLKPALLATVPSNTPSRQALQILRDWDGRHTPDSVASTIFAAWYSRLAAMPNDDLEQDGYWNNPVFIAQQLRSGGKYCANRAQEIRSCAELLSTTLASSTKALSEELGTDLGMWRWERVHRTRSNHGALGGVKPLGWIWNRSVSAPGGLFTVNVGGYDLASLRQTHGASYRQLIDLAEPDNSRFVGSLGQAGNPMSPHYADQQELWRSGAYLPMSTRPQDWGAIRVLTLTPRR